MMKSVFTIDPTFWLLLKNCQSNFEQSENTLNSLESESVLHFLDTGIQTQSLSLEQIELFLTEQAGLVDQESLSSEFFIVILMMYDYLTFLSLDAGAHIKIRNKLLDSISSKDPSAIEVIFKILYQSIYDDLSNLKEDHSYLFKTRLFGNSSKKFVKSCDIKTYHFAKRIFCLCKHAKRIYRRFNNFIPRFLLNSLPNDEYKIFSEKNDSKVFNNLNNIGFEKNETRFQKENFEYSAFQTRYDIEIDGFNRFSHILALERPKVNLPQKDSGQSIDNPSEKHYNTNISSSKNNVSPSNMSEAHSSSAEINSPEEERLAQYFNGCIPEYYGKSTFREVIEEEIKNEKSENPKLENDLRDPVIIYEEKMQRLDTTENFITDKEEPLSFYGVPDEEEHLFYMPDSNKEEERLAQYFNGCIPEYYGKSTFREVIEEEIKNEKSENPELENDLRDPVIIYEEKMQRLDRLEKGSNPDKQVTQ